MTSPIASASALSTKEGAVWRAIQLLGVAATVLLIAGLIGMPATTLTVFWNLVIPLLPATFLLNPAVWRNVCPLATLNIATNGWFDRRQLRGRVISLSTTLGIALLFLLVPARRYLFNTNGVALVIVIIVVAFAAVALGTVFDMKGGFCNSICPVLPVERLYGQSPLVRINNPRCVSCRTCTAPGCIDLAPTKSIAQTLGQTRKSQAWLATPFGLFGASFPGFVVGYFMTEDAPLTAAASTYGQIAIWAGASLLLSNLVIRLFNISAKNAIFVIAAVAVGLYYWFAAPVVTGALGLPTTATAVIRAGALVLVTIWLWRGWLKGSAA